MLSNLLIETKALEIKLDSFNTYIDHFIYNMTGDKYYSDPEIKAVTDYIASDPALWEQAEILVSSIRKGIKRAVIVGEPFQKSFLKAINNKNSFSWFYGDRKAQGKYHIADTCMLVERKEEEIWFESWSYLRDLDGECFYTHAIYNENSDFFRHFDAAKFHITDEQKRELTSNKKKPRGLNYQKMFVLNGIIPEKDVFSIMKLFLPFDELTEEMLE